MREITLEETRNVSLCELLDRVLNKGAVISGEVAISVADIELIKLGLQLVIASSDTLLKGTELLKVGPHSGSSTGRTSAQGEP